MKSKSRGQSADDPINVEDNDSWFRADYSDEEDHSTAVDEGGALSSSHEAALARERIDLKVSPAVGTHLVHKTLESPARHSTIGSRSPAKTLLRNDHIHNN